jgi:copper homeostasis protein
VKFKVEICVDSTGSAIVAQSAGADRVELCDNLIEGGTTPGYGTIVTTRKNIDIALNVIIRPRGGDFLYSDLDYDTMRRDIDICGECGVDGIVIGILRADGTVDVERTAMLIEMAHPMKVTFHRAFDMIRDPFSGLEDVIDTGADRILTSGHKNQVPDGTELINKLISKAHNRIIIMPGGGINISNIEMVAKTTGASEFHFTGRKSIESSMSYRKEGIFMGGHPDVPEFSRKVADAEIIRGVIDILSKI